MDTAPDIIPFVDLSFQHAPIQAKLDQAIRSVIDQNAFVLGQPLVEFESAFANACRVDYGVGVASGTDAIAIGLQACGIGEGDEVVLPANTFIATLIAVLQTGATPVLVDCDLQTGLIDLVAAEKAITGRTRAIVPVHLFGQMVSPQKLLDLSGMYDLFIFEDAAQAHLAEREGRRAGSVGIAAAFSFYPSKNLGAFGDGGMVVTREVIIAQTLRSLRNYGSTRKYYYTDQGKNSRLDTIQAAILNTKLSYLVDWNEERYQIAQTYDALLEPLRSKGIVVLENQSGKGHVYHLYVIRVTEACALDRATLQTELEAQGIQTGIHYPVPCHFQPAYAYLGYQPGDFPNTELLSQEILSLPMYPGLSKDRIQRIVSTINRLIDAAALTELQPTPY